MVYKQNLKKSLCLALLERIWKTCRRISSEQGIYNPSVRTVLVILFRLGLVERKKVKVQAYASSYQTYRVFMYKLKPNVSEKQLFNELGLNPPRTYIK